MRRLSPIFVLLVLAGHAHAHDLPAKRHILAQVTPTAVRIMITHEEPKNERTELLMAQFDVNRDGQLAPEEAKLATPTWSKYVLSGLTFEVQGEHPKAREPKFKLERTDRGAIATAVLLEFELPKAKEKRTLVARASEKTKTPSKIVVEGAEGLRLDNVNGYPPPRRPMPAVALGPGQELRFELRVTHGR